MADSLAECAAKFDKVGDLLTGAKLKQISTRLGTAAKKDALTAAAKDVGADLAMSNWKRAKLGARFDVVGDDTVKVKPTPSGPWKVITDGAGSHEVSAKLGRIKGRGASLRRNERNFNQAFGVRGVGVYSGATPLSTPFGPRYRVRVAKSRGKGTWDDAVKVIGRESPKRVHREVVKALSEVF